MSEMTFLESKERFSDSMKKAAARSIELGIAQQNPIWNQIAASLDTMRKRGEAMASGKGKTRQEILKDFEAYNKETAIKNGEKNLGTFYV